MTDYISRQAVMNLWNRYHPTIAVNAETFGAELKALPSAPVREVVTGEWIKDSDGNFICSVCHSGYKEQPTLMGKPMFEFCPMCGADMRKE